MIHNMPVPARILFFLMNSGKDLEVRVAFRRFESIQENDILVFSSNCIRRVKKIRRYDSFALMLQTESADRIGPGYAAPDILSELRRIYPANQERLGVIVFELVTEEK